MEAEIKQALANIASSYLDEPIEAELSYPDPDFGDFSSNVALKLAKILKLNPKTLAEEICTKLISTVKTIAAVEVAGPGFINIKLSDRSLIEELERERTNSLAGKAIIIEFSDPNPFKILHAGHLYTSIVGQAMANLMEAAGATIYRVNYGGDVGMHVAKSLWAMTKSLNGENPDGLNQIEPAMRSEWMSQVYIEGNSAYELDEAAKEAITDLNKRVYQIHDSDDHESALAKIYWQTRQWSYESFNQFYKSLNISFTKYYPESQIADIGLQMVKDHLGSVFEESDGAVVFRGEKFGLHTRVFINALGLPTYEAKELGLARLKAKDFNYDQSIIITGNEQEQYLRVVLKALEQFEPKLVESTTHLTHGMVRLSGGKKMSSRLGNIVKAEDVIQAAKQAAEDELKASDERVVLAAVKYAMLKPRMGGDVIFDPKESVNVLGNSGPYLQYAHARACSILEKAGSGTGEVIYPIDPSERQLVLKLTRYVSAVETATDELSPHLLCNYLYELAQSFNQFYEASRVIGDPREKVRLKLVKAYADRLKTGLNLLGIDAPDKL